MHKPVQVELQLDRPQLPYSETVGPIIAGGSPAHYRRRQPNPTRKGPHRGPVWWASSNTHFYILNNFIHILTHFFTHIYIKNTQTILLKFLYQMSPESWGLFLVLQILWARSPLDWARPTSPNLNKRATNQPYYPNHLGQLSFTFVLQLNALWFANTYTGHPYSSFLFIFKSKGISI